MGGFFSLAGTASINDVFFVHERGLRVGLWNAAVICSVNLAPVVSSRIIVDLGWRWAFWILAIGFGVLVFAVTICMAESQFERQVIDGESMDFGERASRSDPTIRDTLGKSFEDTAAPAGPDTLPPAERESHEAPVSVWSLLDPRPARVGTIHETITSLVEPLTLLLHPATIWACVMWSVTFSWVIIQGAVASQIFAFPPYSMTPTAVGNLIGIAPLIGSLLGTLSGGYICDVAALHLSHRNQGIYEPEFRLSSILVACLVPLAIGTFGLGAAIANELSPITCGFFLATLNFAIGTGCTGIVAYSNDVFGDRAGQVFGLAMLVKSAFAFGLTFMLNDYYARHGPMVFFSTWGALSVGATLVGTSLMYVYGKRVRAWHSAAVDGKA
jgi:hypothetical protein